MIREINSRCRLLFCETVKYLSVHTILSFSLSAVNYSLQFMFTSCYSLFSPYFLKRKTMFCTNIWIFMSLYFYYFTSTTNTRWVFFKDTGIGHFETANTRRTPSKPQAFYTCRPRRIFISTIYRRRCPPLRGQCMFTFKSIMIYSLVNKSDFMKTEIIIFQFMHGPCVHDTYYTDCCTAAAFCNCYNLYYWL